MKLTGELKDKVESVETKEEMKAIIAEAGIELTDDELDGVAGGVTWKLKENYTYDTNR